MGAGYPPAEVNRASTPAHTLPGSRAARASQIAPESGPTAVRDRVQTGEASTFPWGADSGRSGALGRKRPLLPLPEIEILYWACGVPPCLCGTWPAVGRVARCPWYFWGPLEFAVRGCKGRDPVSVAGWRRWYRSSSARICSGRRRRELWLLQVLRQRPPPQKLWLLGHFIPPLLVLLASGFCGTCTSLLTTERVPRPKKPIPSTSESTYRIKKGNQN